MSWPIDNDTQYLIAYCLASNALASLGEPFDPSDTGEERYAALARKLLESTHGDRIREAAKLIGSMESITDLIRTASEAS